ncbi:hypothetical protein [Curtobacterium sp. MCSS17_016]|uniref:hypothetical protein n=1 Tax=Curtobacterium sp. MCSS17_016 TaxID=2175644 RepID=UPI000DA82468|nr:hypothetical protein [Curtobacterium sp. MCSS17_016]WIE81211.1 hypothetical protein DEJ19_018430 [Curtobacterium sp. MCSS17_016]
MRDDKDTIVERLSALITAHREPGAKPTYNDFSLAEYLYAHSVGIIEGRPSAAGGAALRGAATIFTSHPGTDTAALLTALATAAAGRGDNEQAHALASALDAWNTDQPGGDPATWLIARSVYVETGGDGD